ALLWSSGTYRFEQRPVEAVSGVPDMRISPVALVMEAAKRSADPVGARAWLEQRASEQLHRSPELEREMFALKSFWPGESVSPTATGGRTVGEVLGRIKAAEAPLLQALCASGLLQMSGGNRAAAPKAQSAQAAADEDRGKNFSGQEHIARKMLFDERERLRDASHYDVLGVPHDAPVDEIKKSYFVMAKTLHSD